MKKPNAPSCERNKAPILEVLVKYLKNSSNLLEVGSGTGQHAIYFAPHFPKLTWTMSEMDDKHAGINAWLNEAKATNIRGPLSFELGKDPFPTKNIDAIFTANTFHIMPWEMVLKLIVLAGENLGPDSLFIIYGPFRYNGEFTSKSNEEFHENLRQRASHQGIREFKNVHEQFNKCGFSLADDIAMPANNQILIYKKIGNL